MNKINVLDCTLRDGGYINNWEFGKNTIEGIIHNLLEAHIDIIECGFIRKVDSNKNSSVFSSMESIKDIIGPKREDTLYAVMLEQHNYVKNLISCCSEKTPDIIRLTFRRKEWEDAKRTAEELMSKGYKVCIQPVGTASYDDPSLIKLLQDVNVLNPFAFYLVDTLGLMCRHEVRRFFYLIDNNLAHNIIFGFHSHNNLQMSFANAQEVMSLSRNRTIIIDSSCYGMGRGVGNLATELLTDYINNNIEQRYSITPILNIVDKYLMPIYARQRWGYDLPYFISATFKCHPNYASYLIRKETLSIERIEKVLSLIPAEKRNEYDGEFIEKLYLDIQECSFDDLDSYEKMKNQVCGKEVLIVGSGASIKKYKEDIDRVCEGKFVISVNFVPDDLTIDALFVSNEKRLRMLDLSDIEIVLVSSNLSKEILNAWVFDYSSLLGEGSESDNSGAMLIKLLKKSGAKKIFIAGFDGFEVDSTNNFAVTMFEKAFDYDSIMKKNKDISKQLNLALRGVEYEIITPTKYTIGDI